MQSLGQSLRVLKRTLNHAVCAMLKIKKKNEAKGVVVKARFCLLTVFILITVPIAHADQISIYNKSNVDVWAAIYYYEKDPLERVTQPFLVKSQSSIKVERPGYKFLVDRYLLVDTLAHRLQPKVTIGDMSNVLKIDIGITNGVHFYINAVDGRLKGFNQLDWTIAPGREKIEGFLNATKN